MHDWRYKVKDKPYGPVDENQLLHLLESGFINTQTLIYTPKIAKWISIEEAHLLEADYEEVIKELIAITEAERIARRQAEAERRRKALIAATRVPELTEEEKARRIDKKRIAKQTAIIGCTLSCLQSISLGVIAIIYLKHNHLLFWL